jgi:hypothetical protein
MYKKPCRLCQKPISKTNLSRHTRNHVWCEICKQWTTKKRHHVHQETKSITENDDGAGIQIWVPLMISVEHIRKLWPDYKITDVAPSPHQIAYPPQKPSPPIIIDNNPANIVVIAPETSDDSIPPYAEDLMRTYFPELATDTNIDGFVSELKESIKDSANKVQSFEDHYYSDIRYWGYNVELLKNLVCNE